MQVVTLATILMNNHLIHHQAVLVVEQVHLMPMQHLVLI
jgi:hypothetical protein